MGAEMYLEFNTRKDREQARRNAEKIFMAADLIDLYSGDATLAEEVREAAQTLYDLGAENEE